jgi:hypothetical protein
MQLSPVQHNLQKGAELGVRTNMFEELQSLSYTLFWLEMAESNSEVPARTEDDCTMRFGTVAHLRETCWDHFLLYVMKLLSSHVTARKTVLHTWEPHYPVGYAGFVATQRSFAFASCKAIAL